MAWTRRSMWRKAQSSEVEKKSGWRVKRRGGKSDTNLFTVSSAKRGRAQNKAEKGGRAVGRSNDKFLGPRVPGVAGDNSEVWGGSDDYRFFTRQCGVCARRYCLQISQRWGRIWSLKGFGNFVLWIKRTKSDRSCDTGHWLLQPLDKGECCLIWDKSQICWEARLSGSASVPQDLTTHFNSHNTFLDSNGTTISQYLICLDKKYLRVAWGISPRISPF